MTRPFCRMSGLKAAFLRTRTLSPAPWSALPVPLPPPLLQMLRCCSCYCLPVAVAVAVAVAGVAADVLSSRHCALFSGGQTRAHDSDDDDDDGLRWATLGM